MEPSNVIDNYDVAIFTEGQRHSAGDLPLLGKSGKFAKTIFYFLKADKNNCCKVIVHGKAVNHNNGEEMKVLSHLLFTGKEKLTNVLKEMLPKLWYQQII